MARCPSTKRLPLGRTFITTAGTVAVRDSLRSEGPVLANADAELPPMLSPESVELTFNFLSSPKNASILAELVELRERLVSADRLALATSSMLMTTKSLACRARASVNNIEAGRPSRHKLPGDDGSSSPLPSVGNLYSRCLGVYSPRCAGPHPIAKPTSAIRSIRVVIEKPPQSGDRYHPCGPRRACPCSAPRRPGCAHRPRAVPGFLWPLPRRRRRSGPDRRPARRSSSRLRLG